TTSISRAPASMAFSTSSLTTLAGRSITSPAAMRLMVSGESCRMATGPLPRNCAGSGGLLQPLARQNLAQLDRRLIERIDAEQTAGENRLQHEMHQVSAQRALIQAIDVDKAHRPSRAGQRSRNALSLCRHEVARMAARHRVEARQLCELRIDPSTSACCRLPQHGDHVLPRAIHEKLKLTVLI